MYGFHKRVGLSDNSMKASERKNKSPSEYYNPYFKRGHPNLLWLINKPKGGNASKKAKGARVKNEEGEADSDDEGRDGVEETFSGNYNQNQGTRAISVAPESGPLQRREITQVQTQLQEIQKQQGAISSAIARLRNDHNQLYKQAVAFQTLHDRHESSINAILTFLATVYNRSLDGQGGGNIAQMFANSIPQDQQQHQGNVVDIGDVGNQQQNAPGSISPLRRQQRLLMAPPTAGQQGSRTSPNPSTQSPMTNNSYDMNQTQRSGAIEELFETSPSGSPQVKTEDTPGASSLPQQDMMNIINNTNASQHGRSGSRNNMNFPDVLSHYETANGNRPLTSAQRNDMLQMIAGGAAGGTNNALVSPTPPPQPSLADLGYTQAELDELVRMQQEQEAKLGQVSALIQPLSPSGSIPGLGDNGYFGNDAADLNSAGNNLDLDQFLDPSAYYSNGNASENGNYDYNSFGGNGVDTSNFDFGFDGANDASGGSIQSDGGRIVETAGSSEAATPEDTEAQQEQGQAGANLQRSPSKRRRKG
jgi:heat shock transcription factor